MTQTPPHWEQLNSASLTLRRDRAALKRQIRRREVSPADVLLNPPACAAGMRVFELLEAAPHVGRKKIEQINVAAAWHGVNLMREIGCLSERSRSWLIHQLPPLQAQYGRFSARPWHEGTEGRVEAGSILA